MEVALAFVAEAVPVLAVDIWSLAVCAVGYQCVAVCQRAMAAGLRRLQCDDQHETLAVRCR